MKMVAASRLRRAQERTQHARPFATQMLSVLNNLASRVDPTTHPLLDDRAVPKAGGKVLLFDAASGKLEERKIKAGLANWEYTEILDGLAAGDRIVTSLEKEGVKAGARVTPDDKAKAR